MSQETWEDMGMLQIEDEQTSQNSSHVASQGFLKNVFYHFFTHTMQWFSDDSDGVPLLCGWTTCPLNHSNNFFNGEKSLFYWLGGIGFPHFDTERKFYQGVSSFFTVLALGATIFGSCALSTNVDVIRRTYWGAGTLHNITSGEQYSMYVGLQSMVYINCPYVNAFGNDGSNCYQETIQWASAGCGTRTVVNPSNYIPKYSIFSSNNQLLDDACSVCAEQIISMWISVVLNCVTVTLALLVAQARMREKADVTFQKMLGMGADTIGVITLAYPLFVVEEQCIDSIIQSTEHLTGISQNIWIGPGYICYITCCIVALMRAMMHLLTPLPGRGSDPFACFRAAKYDEHPNLNESFRSSSEPAEEAGEENDIERNIVFDNNDASMVSDLTDWPTQEESAMLREERKKRKKEKHSKRSHKSRSSAADDAITEEGGDIEKKTTKDTPRRRRKGGDEQEGGENVEITEKKGTTSTPRRRRRKDGESNSNNNNSSSHIGEAIDSNVGDDVNIDNATSVFESVADGTPSKAASSTGKKKKKPPSSSANTDPSGTNARVRKAPSRLQLAPTVSRTGEVGGHVEEDESVATCQQPLSPPQRVTASVTANEFQAPPIELTSAPASGTMTDGEGNVSNPENNATASAEVTYAGLYDDSTDASEWLSVLDAKKPKEGRKERSEKKRKSTLKKSRSNTSLGTIEAIATAAAAAATAAAAAASTSRSSATPAAPATVKTASPTSEIEMDMEILRKQLPEFLEWLSTQEIYPHLLRKSGSILGAAGSNGQLPFDGEDVLDFVALHKEFPELLEWVSAYNSSKDDQSVRSSKSAVTTASGTILTPFSAKKEEVEEELDFAALRMEFPEVLEWLSKQEIYPHLARKTRFSNEVSDEISVGNLSSHFQIEDVLVSRENDEELDFAALQCDFPELFDWLVHETKRIRKLRMRSSQKTPLSASKTNPSQTMTSSTATIAKHRGLMRSPLRRMSQQVAASSTGEESSVGSRRRKQKQQQLQQAFPDTNGWLGFKPSSASPISRSLVRASIHRTPITESTKVSAAAESSRGVSSAGSDAIRIIDPVDPHLSMSFRSDAMGGSSVDPYLSASFSTLDSRMHPATSWQPLPGGGVTASANIDKSAAINGSGRSTSNLRSASTRRGSLTAAPPPVRILGDLNPDSDRDKREGHVLFSKPARESLASRDRSSSVVRQLEMAQKLPLPTRSSSAMALRQRDNLKEKSQQGVYFVEPMATPQPLLSDKRQVSSKSTKTVGIYPMSLGLSFSGSDDHRDSPKGKHSNGSPDVVTKFVTNDGGIVQVATKSRSKNSSKRSSSALIGGRQQPRPRHEELHPRIMNVIKGKHRDDISVVNL